MPRLIPLLLISSCFTTTAWSLDQYIILESGQTHSSPVSNDLIDESVIYLQESNNMDTSLGLLYGQYLTEKLSIELGYSNLGEIIVIPLKENKLIQDAESFNLQARYQLATINHFSFSAHLE